MSVIKTTLLSEARFRAGAGPAAPAPASLSGACIAVSALRDTLRPALHVGAPSRFVVRTRLYAEAAQVNIHLTRSRLQNRALRIKVNATVFNHPQISSTRLRFVWLAV
jgi:hypothetical protein